MRALVWFRADLRCQDNPALYHATHAADQGVIGLFVICSQQWKQHDWGDRRVAFLQRNLLELSVALRKLGIPLLIRKCPLFADVPVVVADAVHRYACDAVYVNKEYEINERRRDQAVTTFLKSSDCRVFAYDDQVILPPGTVQKSDGSSYVVFTPFKKAWIQTLAQRGGPTPVLSPKPQPWPSKLDKEDVGEVPESIDGFDHGADRVDLWPAGEAHAHERLQRFVSTKIQRYQEDRDVPAVSGTSAISPYVALGVVSVNQCIHAVTTAIPLRWIEIASQQSGAATWISELVWREFYRHLLVSFPRLCMYQPFQAKTLALVWRQHDHDFHAWCAGKTGYPIVDAAMQQLQQTGWMHNRLRMIVAMFLTKHLLIDWRKGERYFMQQLVDGDLANNNGGWQWSASTGTDAAPYFRIFNPWHQSQRFDPDGVFIKTMLPMLSQIPTDALHNPDKLSRHRPPDYPEPICDHREARQRAIEAFRALDVS